MYSALTMYIKLCVCVHHGVCVCVCVCMCVLMFVCHESVCVCPYVHVPLHACTQPIYNRHLGMYNFPH